ncbi:MAG: DUF501 domain-containing protein [Acidimicrobiales bacterium]
MSQPGPAGAGGAAAVDTAWATDAPADPDAPAVPRPPAVPDAAGDAATVTELLGRPPGADFTVARRDGSGRPVVICNAAHLRDGTPMPTLYWLVDPDLRRAVDRLEAAGGVKQAEVAVDPDALAGAHRRYAARRDAAIPAWWAGPRPSGGVGGTRRGVKCLHAHYAWYLAGGDDPVGAWVHARLGR